MTPVDGNEESLIDPHMLENEQVKDDLFAPIPATESSSHPTIDVDIVNRCRSGDSGAWELLVRTFSRRIYNLAYRFVARHELAEDLTQDVFVRIYKSLDQYDPSLGDLSNWLMRLARNLIIDDYRRRQRQPVDGGDDIENHTHYLRSRVDTPHKHIERKERRLQVREAIEKLSPDLRQCVIMRDIDELTYQEIVDRLQIPEGTVKSRINRGRIELAKVLRRMKVISID
ncbi:MAG: sigma-70 family RNA polymerase sigma factor [Blastocatellia bacterium]|nr:sigma-70 family RNA polymerase sigma factor [Blastocatellia bacterium]